MSQGLSFGEVGGPPLRQQSPCALAIHSCTAGACALILIASRAHLHTMFMCVHRDVHICLYQAASLLIVSCTCAHHARNATLQAHAMTTRRCVDDELNILQSPTISFRRAQLFFKIVMVGIRTVIHGNRQPIYNW